VLPVTVGTRDGAVQLVSNSRGGEGEGAGKWRRKVEGREGVSAGSCRPGEARGDGDTTHAPS
jgi:hypothetical protein